MKFDERIAAYQRQINDNIKKANSIAESDDFDPAAVKAITDENAGLIERIESLKALKPTGGEWLPVGGSSPEEQATKGLSDAAREASDSVKASRFAAGLSADLLSIGDRKEQSLKAYRFGKWLTAQAGNRKAAQWCEERGIKTAMSEGDNSLGGALVPEEFVPDLIILREQYGTFRNWAQVVTMGSDVQSRPRLSTSLTVYSIGESDTITESNPTFDQVRLTAKKIAALARTTSELSDDSTIEIGAFVAGEMAYQFALAEDNAGYIGDGTSTYYGIVGVTPKLKALSGTIANIAGLTVGTGNAYSELVLTDFEAVAGNLPLYADAGAEWVVHKSFYYNVMVKLALAAGGVTGTEIAGGRRQPMFLGYPVRFSQVMPKTEANSQVCAILGDGKRAALMGDRKMLSVEMDRSVGFTTDEIVWRGIQRFDINVHSVGNASATAGLRVPGPVVGLITAAS